MNTMIMNTMTKDMTTIFNMGPTKCASVIYYLLNPSKDSERALEFFERSNEVTGKEMAALKRLSNEHADILKRLKRIQPNAKEEYRECCETYGKEVIDFLLEVVQQC